LIALSDCPLFAIDSGICVRILRRMVRTALPDDGLRQKLAESGAYPNGLAAADYVDLLSQCTAVIVFADNLICQKRTFEKSES